MKEELSGEQTAQILDLAARLRERQGQKDHPTKLPRVELSDIPAETTSPVPSISDGKSQHYRYTAGTNGLVYQQWISPLPALTSAEQQHLPLVTALMAEVGVGDLDYLETQERHSATVGSLSASVSSRAQRDDEQACDSYFVLSSKALADRMAPQLTLMSDTLQHARFDEHSRIRDLVSQMRARRDQGITGSGHALAMSAACAGMSPLARMGHEQGGLEGIRRMRALDDVLKQDGELEALSHSLSAIHRKLAAAGAPLLCTIADEPNIAQASESAAAAAPTASRHQQRIRWKVFAKRATRSGSPIHRSTSARRRLQRCPLVMRMLPYCRYWQPSCVTASCIEASGNKVAPMAAVPVMTRISPHSGSSHTATPGLSRPWMTLTPQCAGCWKTSTSSSHSRRRFSV